MYIATLVLFLIPCSERPGLDLFKTPPEWEFTIGVRTSRLPP